MSTVDGQDGSAPGDASVGKVDMKLEAIVIPVADVDRSTELYRSLGWRKDVTPPGVVQFTPPGSGCSIQFGGGRTTAAPGSAQRTILVVTDLEADHGEHEARTGEPDANWPDWYADSMVAEQPGAALPS